MKREFEQIKSLFVFDRRKLLKRFLLFATVSIDFDVGHHSFFKYLKADPLKITEFPVMLNQQK